MAKRLYVGNLAFNVTSEALRELFEAHGTVKKAQVMIDRETNRSRGFGFVEMEQDDQAETAIERIDGTELLGRRLNVNEARPQTAGRPTDDRGQAGGGRHGGGGRSSFRGGY